MSEEWVKNGSRRKWWKRCDDCEDWKEAKVLLADFRKAIDWEAAAKEVRRENREKERRGDGQEAGGGKASSERKKRGREKGKGKASEEGEGEEEEEEEECEKLAGAR
jgi:hypothetical protein